jgi:hypothetical protein
MLDHDHGPSYQHSQHIFTQISTKFISLPKLRHHACRRKRSHCICCCQRHREGQDHRPMESTTQNPTGRLLRLQLHVQVRRYELVLTMILTPTQHSQPYQEIRLALSSSKRAKSTTLRRSLKVAIVSQSKSTTASSMGKLQERERVGFSSFMTRTTRCSK